MAYDGGLDGANLENVKSRVLDDGRIDISFKGIHLRAQEFVHLVDKRHAKAAAVIAAQDDKAKARKPRHCVRRLETREPNIAQFKGIPRMNIAILITGSRGDVQPFIALGQTLQKDPYSHRVRICTHSVFKDFVEENGLEFYSIGGDPSKLMAYMVKNPGILPSRESVKAGDIHARRMEIAEMLDGCWRACTLAGDGITQFEMKDYLNDRDIMMHLPEPFVADAIIANPPSYAHIHIAEKLAIPLHIMFTMPWSPTGAFPHPLANVDSGKVDSKLANLFSYKRMDLLTWEGLFDLINRFREDTLMLDPITPIWGHEILPRLQVPFTYCWPEVLIPKPADWGPHITISGYWFLPLASSFKPEPALQEFLDAGPPPVYIGFGSIVVDDPEKLTQMIFDAVKKAGVRALVSKGWGNVGGTNPPDNVFLLGNVPHDWLFPRVSAVVHHGGAGTTAIGIALGKPTVIVPFFGDQPWWAAMIYRAGAGPKPVPFKELTADALAENITEALKTELQSRAEELAEKIRGEDGTKKAAEDFHKTLQMQNLSCFLCPDRVAVWRVRKTNIQLSTLAAAMLIVTDTITSDQLKLVRHKDWHTTAGSQQPISAIIGTATNTAANLISDCRQLAKELSSTPIEGSTGKSTDSDTSNDKNMERTTTHRPKQKRKAWAHFAGSVFGHSLKAPVAFFYNLANGFHNCPAFLMSDRTVRTYPPITNLSSGLSRSGKEFGFGLYDAVTGVVTQPYLGYKYAKENQHSAVGGVAKGVARGFGGLVLKSGAAVTGIPGYGFKGLEREIERWWKGSDVFLHGDPTFIMAVKDQAATREQMKKGERTRMQMMFDDSKGSGMGKRILERRVWQSYRDLRTLQSRTDYEVVQKEILDRWEMLKADTSNSL
ncbi:UDP-Glycosyltransferase/glycogen phosphorylase [Microthyrium microscopicum]|uniref:UDP-Glycosyltransferase/glycogen phosphorylase n=1 Tax=Microthyrium microscopicum TaxID=703497 RepID=A0A6A6UBX6_9PEZI|nr:UDP-Glycosyltransferase/glycogen phosphorylase [Microthyrium microscopicum]